jgi:hypothetical protein
MSECVSCKRQVLGDQFFWIIRHSDQEFAIPFCGPCKAALREVVDDWSVRDHLHHEVSRTADSVAGISKILVAMRADVEVVAKWVKKIRVQLRAKRLFMSRTASAISGAAAKLSRIGGK